jgi:DNA-binding CsgD family transcriptional regulator
VGRVYRETLNQNRGTHEWEAISFSDIDTIKGLIKNRFEFDENYVMQLYETNNPLESNGVPLFHEIITCTYLDLERLIDNANLTEKQNAIIDMFMQGYNEYEIADSFKDDVSNINSVLDTACQKIKEQNDFEWQEWVEISGLVKIPDDVNYKRCTKCHKWLRADEENFSPDSRNRDGLQGICKKCDSYRKKTP